MFALDTSGLMLLAVSFSLIPKRFLITHFLKTKFSSDSGMILSGDYLRSKDTLF